MHPGAFLLSLIAVGAAATPLVERDYVTNVEYYTKVVTVTAGGGHYPHRPHRHHHHHHHHHQYPKPTASPTVFNPPPHPYHKSSTEEAPVPVKTHKAHHPKPPPASGYQGLVIQHHNVHRANHSAPPVQWDQGLADTAMKIAQSCVYAHNTDMDGGGYGQNIAAGISAADIGDAISDAFYNGEVNSYTYYGEEPNMSDFESYGHFTQIVWKGTHSVGCATYDCGSSGLSGVSGDVSPCFTVCNYKGPGNFAGEYAANVGRPLGKPTFTGSD